MSFSDDVNAVSGMIRTLLVAGVIGVLGYGGGWVYTHYAPNVRLKQAEQDLRQVRAALVSSQQQVQEREVRIAELNRAVHDRELEIDKLNASMRLLKVDMRVADVAVVRQEHDRTTGELLTDFRFQETTAEGRPIAEPRMFRIAGDLLYLDFWIVKFDDHFIEEADLDRSTNLCLFRRLFGEFQEPHDGYTLDEVGSLPAPYGQPETMSEFERQVWNEFWNIATDPQRAAMMGIRAAHGEAVAIKLRTGKRYRVTLRASDGLSVGPPEDIFAPQADPEA
jgi:uncharacterized coiled-coil protein SlyX